MTHIKNQSEGHNEFKSISKRGENGFGIIIKFSVYGCSSKVREGLLR